MASRAAVRAKNTDPLRHDVPSFCTFVDDALFHPAWGYYATGAVRLGLGGHYDTYPLALSPHFGRMVAAHAHRVWRDAGMPPVFELCEIGAGNGQLATDVLGAVIGRSRNHSAWRHFNRALRYRILERSPSLVRRQRAHLGPLARRITWTTADLTRRAVSGSPLGSAGLVFGNEVLDCFAPHRVVPQRLGVPQVTFVVPWLDGQVLSRRALARAMAAENTRRRVRFRELLRPVDAVPSLPGFLRRHYPEFFLPGRPSPPYFACTQIEPFLRNTARLYRRSEAIFIDYGDTREFHLNAPEERRLFVGQPHSGRGLYADPGNDDVTVIVDFSVVMSAAARAGWTIEAYGPQALLARGTHVRLDARARDLITRSRTLGWLLAVLGVDSQSEWQQTALTWAPTRGRGGSLRDAVERDVQEFLGQRPTPFRLLRLRRG